MVKRVQGWWAGPGLVGDVAHRAAQVDDLRMRLEACERRVGAEVCARQRAIETDRAVAHACRRTHASTSARCVVACRPQTSAGVEGTPR